MAAERMLEVVRRLSAKIVLHHPVATADTVAPHQQLLLKLANGMGGKEGSTCR